MIRDPRGFQALCDRDKSRDRHGERKASGEILSKEEEPGHLQCSPGAFPISGLQAEAVPSDRVYSDIGIGKSSRRLVRGERMLDFLKEMRKSARRS